MGPGRTGQAVARHWVGLSFSAALDDNLTEKGFLVRPLIGIIATVATVIHFTFGCCLHPCHQACPRVCSAQPVQTPSSDHCCHGHEEGVEGTAAAASFDEFAPALATSRWAASEESDHGGDCSGCHCTATSTSEIETFQWSPMTSGILATVDSDLIRLCARHSEARPSAPYSCQGQRALRLCERLLI